MLEIRYNCGFCIYGLFEKDCGLFLRNEDYLIFRSAGAIKLFWYFGLLIYSSSGAS